ncbi:hypothetical protein FA15DRAFT_681051 [Coprinopsis marcescibilis]|uniref:F-box domain-containing protein n=1 Tax=Coprinopsis marcescibilis TaxID=230819 RepID=A0A5C3KT47_COPMA|nr:hypothetical protein FA15DRAFT_681051 [Coprinopsis marcescibilis]
MNEEARAQGRARESSRKGKRSTNGASSKVASSSSSTAVAGAAAAEKPKAKPGSTQPATSKIRQWFASSSSSSSSPSSKRAKRSSKRKADSSKTVEEEQISTTRSNKSFKALFSRRPSTSSTVSLCEKRRTPFVPWLPPELWIIIFHYATSPSHPFLSSALLKPSAPFSFIEFTHSHSHLLSAYRRSMRFKASLTYVCKMWHAVGQEVLYEFIWITRAREAAMLAELLGRKAIRDISSASQGNGKGKTKERVSVHGKNKRHTSQLSDTTNFDYNNKGAYTYPYDTRGVGRHIRRLHIETGTLDRCAPLDLLAILDHSPLLQVYSDYQSIRRTTGFSIIAPSTPSGGSRPGSRGSEHSAAGAGGGAGGGGTHVHSFRDNTQLHQQASDQQVLSALLTNPGRAAAIRRLSWTNYEYEPEDYEGGVRYYLRVVGPKLEVAKEGLEYLELKLCKKDLRGMSGQGGTGGGFFESLLSPVGFGQGVRADQLTTLSASLVSTVTTRVTGLVEDGLGGVLGGGESSGSSSSRPPFDSPPLVLPALQSLKVTLDNATFHVLSTWDMPVLKNLSVISADFSYAGEGFAKFFEIHGGKLGQLELGHSTGAIEEFWLTAPPAQGGGGGNFNANANNNFNNANNNANNNFNFNANNNANANGNGNANANGNGNNTTPPGWTFGPTQIPLAHWCPNLVQFICSADAEWNWQNPDWIAPHVLLPAHPTLQFIGVRDIEKRILEGLGRVESRDLEACLEGRVFGGLGMVEEVEEMEADDPFFMLHEQIGSLLRKEAFPNLRYVRDLSWESERMRKSGRVRGGVRGALLGGFGFEEDDYEDDEEDYDYGEDNNNEDEGWWRAEPPRRESNGRGVAHTPAPTGWGFMAHFFPGHSAGGPSSSSSPMGPDATSSSSSSSSSGTALPVLRRSPPCADASTKTSASGKKSTDKPSGKRLRMMQERQQGMRVLRFWARVARMFRDRGVWLEGLDGVNVTVTALRRSAARGVGGGGC